MKIQLPIRWVAAICFILVTVIHPLIHHTPLDSGALEGFFSQIHLFMLGLVSSE